MKYSGAQILIKLLEQFGVDMIAGIPGGSILPIYNELSSSKIKHILVRHEQSAGFIAQGIARTCQKPGICLATSGPGATNLLTAIADAKLDSIPIIAITGQVAKSLIGKEAFQEVDTVRISKPICKKAYFVDSAFKLLTIIPEAFKLSMQGRPGPILIDIPKDVQQEMVEIADWPLSIKIGSKNSPSDNSFNQSINQMLQLISEAQKPLILAGGGALTANAANEIKQLAIRSNIPVITTLMGLSAFPNSEKLFLGMVGMHGHHTANMALKETDLLLIFGARLGDRTTGNLEQFCKHAKIVHVDIEANQINKIKNATIGITADIKTVLKKTLSILPINKKSEWFAHLLNKQTKPGISRFNGPITDLDIYQPINLIKTVGHYAPSDAIITTDVGQHQMWVAQIYPFQNANSFLTSGGLGTMGFGLPTAIGVALCRPKQKVICFSGDGSILMNIQELATLAELDLNITIIVLNNGYLGLVRQQQDFFYEKKNYGSKFQYNPDIARIAGTFGLKSMDINKVSNPHTEIQKVLQTEGPVLINVPIHHNQTVIPMVKPGLGNHHMIGKCYSETAMALEP